MRSPGRFLFWILAKQWHTIVLAALFGTLWMGSIGALPGVIGYAIDYGAASQEPQRLLVWAGVIVALAVLMAVSSLIRHRFAVFNFLQASYRTVQLTARHATRVGAALPRKVATGEAVSAGSTDPESIGNMADVIGRSVGSAVTFTAIGIAVLNISVPLGAVVLIGLPLQVIVMGPLLKPLQNREHDYRVQQGKLTSRANDIVAGLRVLRGIGGEQLFSQRYRQQSTQLQEFGFRVAKTQGFLKGLQTLIPGFLLIAVTWLGATLSVAGEITVGEFIAVFGYTSFLMMPMNTFLETARKYTRAHAAAQRVLSLLHVKAAVDDTGSAKPAHIDSLYDPDSGLQLDAKGITALVCTSESDATDIAERLGRYRDSDVTANGVALRDIDLMHLRRHVLVTDNDSHVFAGTLRQFLDPHGHHEDEDLAEALHVTVASDARDSLGGLDGLIEAGGRNISGGQRQRLRLARALLRDPDILIALEPTSAVDAHTEALIAQRLHQYRSSQSTLVTTSSPLMLESAARVVFVIDGKVVDEGTHDSLMDVNPLYRAMVTRDLADMDQEVQA